MEKYHGFESWLKANDFASWKSYLSFMKQIEKDLGSIDLENISSAAYLYNLLLELQTKNTFMLRSNSNRSNILSGFKSYVTYV